MPNVITANQSGNIGLDLIDEVTTIVAAGVVVEGIGTDGIEADNTDLQIFGNVIGQADGIDFNGGNGAPPREVTIGLTGAVIGEDEGLDLAGAGSRLTVAGLVEGGDSGVVARSDDTRVHITETGVVKGGSNQEGEDGDALAAAIVNIGTAGFTVINDGTLIGDLSPENDLRIAFIDGSFVEELPNDNIINEATFINSGQVTGDLFFLGGEDLYDGRAGGSVNGLINLGAAPDRGLGGDAADNIRGAGGADTLKGGGGDDTLDGDNGGDVIHGGDGDDLTRGGNGNDTIYSGTGNDTVNGGPGDDTLHGGIGNDSMDGGSENDLMTDGAGADFVFGNGFGDTIRAVADGDDDTLDGGFGTDTVEFLAGDGLLVDLVAGTATSVRQGTDTFSNFEVIRTGNGNDVFVGDAAGTEIFSGGGDDDFSGFGSADVFSGGDGNDMIRGGGGDDSLSGGRGNDTLRGAADGDTFIFENAFGVDVIEDFSTSTSGERIDLSAVSAITDFNDLDNNHLSDVGGNATITVGGNTITLLDVASAELEAGDFLF